MTIIQDQTCRCQSSRVLSVVGQEKHQMNDMVAIGRPVGPVWMLS
jgi:hypothetical protein